MVTYSTGLRTELQVTGENSGTWGTITNNNFSQVFEFAIAGVYDVPAITTGTSTTLSNADGPDTAANNQARQNQLVFTGTVSTTHTIQFPATQKTYGLYNNISGGADISARLGATGNTLTVTNGKYRLVSTDGTNWYDILSLAGLYDVAWQAVITADPANATAGYGYFCNTTSAPFTVTLPTSATIGDEICFVDYAGTFDSNNLTIGRNSHNIQGDGANLTVATERAAFTLVYVDATQGWLLKDK